MFSSTVLTELDELIVDLRRMARRLGSGVASLASSAGDDDTIALRRVAGGLRRILIEVERLDIDVDDLRLIGQVGCIRPQRSPLPAATVPAANATPAASADAR